MSAVTELELKRTSPRIYSNSLSFEPQTSEKPPKAFFKLFLINNKVSLPTHPYLIEWGTTNPKTLHEDVDTFIGTYVTKPDKDGNHPNLREAGIFEHNYSNKAEYVRDAIEFYKNHAVAKIVDIYKPDTKMLEAAEKDPNVPLIYEAMAYTENEEFINELTNKRLKGEDIYVSPGVFALDSYSPSPNKIIVNRFIGTHSSIVDHPSHTKPIAFIKKEICNNDHKTCYFKLLTASEMLNLNNNDSQNTNMSTNPNVSVPSANIGAPDPSAVNVHTEVKNAKGETTEVIDTNPTNKNQTQQKLKQEVTNEKKQAIEQVKNEVEQSKEEIEKKAKDEKKDLDKMSKSEILEMMNQWKAETKKEIQEETERRYRQTRKHEILNSYIPSTNEAMKTEYEFYKTLPITPDQLQTILINSKYNPEIQKAIESAKTIKPFSKPNDKPDNMHTAGAVNPAITSHRVHTTTYNDANTGYGSGQTSLRHLTSGKKIPKKFL